MFTVVVRKQTWGWNGLIRTWDIDEYINFHESLNWVTFRLLSFVNLVVFLLWIFQSYLWGKQAFTVRVLHLWHLSYFEKIISRFFHHCSILIKLMTMVVVLKCLKKKKQYSIKHIVFLMMVRKHFASLLSVILKLREIGKNEFYLFYLSLLYWKFKKHFWPITPSY